MEPCRKCRRATQGGSILFYSYHNPITQNVKQHQNVFVSEIQVRKTRQMFKSIHRCQMAPPTHCRHLNLIQKALVALEHACFAGLTRTVSVSLRVMLRGLTSMKRNSTRLEMGGRGGWWRVGENHRALIDSVSEQCGCDRDARLHPEASLQDISACARADRFRQNHLQCAGEQLGTKDCIRNSQKAQLSRAKG